MFSTEVSTNCNNPLDIYSNLWHFLTKDHFYILQGVMELGQPWGLFTCMDSKAETAIGCLVIVNGSWCCSPAQIFKKFQAAL